MITRVTVVVTCDNWRLGGYPSPDYFDCYFFLSLKNLKRIAEKCKKGNSPSKETLAVLLGKEKYIYIYIAKARLERRMQVKAGNMTS